MAAHKALLIRTLHTVCGIGVLLVLGFFLLSGIDHLGIVNPQIVSGAGFVSDGTCPIRYGNGSLIPAEYAGPFNLFAAGGGELLLNVACPAGSTTVSFFASSSDRAHQQILYKNGYRWNGTRWISYTFQGTPSSAGSNWLNLTASTTFSTADLRPPSTYNYVVGYACTRVGGAWKCGCQNTACANPFWQLQAFRTPMPKVQTNGGTTAGGTTSGTTAGGTTTPLTFAATPSTLTGAGTTTLSWTGPNGATSCTASGMWSGTKVPAGSENIFVATSSIFGLICGSANGSVSVTVNQSTATPPIQGVQRRAGHTAGVSYWTLPNTPNGLHPTQSWSGAAALPDGNIYVGGMDHVTNAALYRLRSGVLEYLGDAKAASQSADSWTTADRIEKFHTHPVWFQGKVYVSTMNTSDLDDAYLSAPGIRWYSYSPTGNTFTDLSAGKPNGFEARGNIVTLLPDENRSVIYGMMPPTGELWRYAPGTKTFANLSHPNYNRQYVYPDRYMWLGNNGRVYFTAGNSEHGAPYDQTIFNHVHYYDPATGFGDEPSWQLHGNAIDSGSCQGGTCYLMDDSGNIYKYTATGPTFTYLGQVGTGGTTWVFSVDHANKIAYIVQRMSGVLYEFNLQTRVATQIANLKTIEPELSGKVNLYGYDAFQNGTMYFTAFDQIGSNNNTILVGINIATLKAALH